MTANTNTMPPVPAGLGRIELTDAARKMCERMAAQVEVAPEDEYDYDEVCEGCGYLENECRCNETCDGYECGACGYEPTVRELNRGYCPECRA